MPIINLSKKDSKRLFEFLVLAQKDAVNLNMDPNFFKPSSHEYDGLIVEFAEAIKAVVKLEEAMRKKFGDDY